MTAIAAFAALAQLREGNRRHQTGALLHPNVSVERRLELRSGQRPIAAVLGCSDSRVPPDLVFDQGLGDLFTVRVAGHVLGNSGAASLEFAVEQLRVPLLVVLGHQACGAVRATVESLGAGAPLGGRLPFLAEAIAPAVAEARTHTTGTLVDAVAHAHVRRTVAQLEHLEPLLGPRVAAGELLVVGGFYDLSSGVVEWFDAGAA